MVRLPQLFINGQWLDSSSNKTIDVINPATEKVIASIPLANEKDVNLDILQNYYSSEYSGKAKKQVETKNTDNRTSYSFDIRSLSQLTLIKQYIDFTSELTIVEIGAGAGNFLFSLNQAKFKGRYVAFEPQEQAHECFNSNF